MGINAVGYITGSSPVTVLMLTPSPISVPSGTKLSATTEIVVPESQRILPTLASPTLPEMVIESFGTLARLGT